MTSRNSPCPCGSGKRYKHCCGAISAGAMSAEERNPGSPYARFGDFQQRYRGRGMLPFLMDMPPGNAPSLDWAPPGVMVIEGYLDEASCDRWTDYFGRQPSTPVGIQKIVDVGSGEEPQFVMDERRVTDRVQLGSMEQEVKDVIFGAYRDVILPYYGKELDWMACPDVLKYGPGGKYIVHADNEYWDEEAGRWVRSMDRDISVLLYMNDDYEGGSLYFHNFDLRFKPSRGMLVAFPSDNRYLHAAESLVSGSRLVAVCWSSIKGVEKVNPMPGGATVPR